MSHELRTPLNAIGGYVELIQTGLRGPVSHEQICDLQRIRKSQQHLLGLINDVLNFVKIDAGRVEFDMTDLSVGSVLRDTEVMVAPQLHAKAIRCDYLPCDKSIVVRADRDKMQQILSNLLSNAVKFTEPGGRVSVECEVHAGPVRIHVHDTGIGVAHGKTDRIFDPFIQVHRRLNQPSEGVGLGLAITRDLARAMSGDILVTSTVGQGSTFTLTLPTTI